MNNYTNIEIFKLDDDFSSPAEKSIYLTIKAKKGDYVVIIDNKVYLKDFQYKPAKFLPVIYSPEFVHKHPLIFKKLA